MKSLLAALGALGLPAGSAGLAYAVLQWMPSLIWCVPLVCSLAILACVWFEWHVEAVPRFKTRVEELTGGRLSENLRRRLDAALHGGAAPQGPGERALRGAD